MSLSPGTTLGPYAVTAKIGEGGMGKVYRARETRLDRNVAVKVLPQAFTDDPDRLARFEREAKVLVYSPPLDQLLPTMHAVAPPLASALCVFFFRTQSGRNT